MSTIADTRDVLDLLTDRRGNPAPMQVIHDAATADRSGTAPWCDHTRDRLARAIDLPGSLYRIDRDDLQNTDTTWYCALRRHGRSHLLTDREWSAVGTHVLRAAGLAGRPDSSDCPWILVRENLDTVHLIASLVAFHEEPREVDNSRVLAECRELADVLTRLADADPHIPREADVVLVAAHPDRFVTLAAHNKDIAAHIRDLAWIPGPRYEDTWYHSPFGAGPSEITDLARATRHRLTAAGYIVRVDPALGVTRSAQAHSRITHPTQGSRRHTITPDAPGVALAPAVATPRRRR
ncbi:hypothetical protein [Streptomyces sp. SID3343]|uniref:hypothetical protein n=1 Tax=Streptomyces sp. SID3343 TaxID=2690260 RepID=UPI00136AFB24|nr:hypothetical protein [Streptomyces sp. SID3343]MYW06210.1 hypothetical protein [Streptomyces sp. SID3343]